jgi:hypothetical protein
MLSIQIGLRGEEMEGGDERQMKGCVCAGGAQERGGGWLESEAKA